MYSYQRFAIFKSSFIWTLFSFLAKGPSKKEPNPPKDSKQPAKDKAPAPKQNPQKQGNQPQPLKQQSQNKPKEAPANAKKSAEPQKSSAKSKPQSNTASNASNATADKPKKKRGKKRNDSDEENNPSPGLGIDLKNFPATTKSASKRLKLVDILLIYICSRTDLLLVKLSCKEEHKFCFWLSSKLKNDRNELAMKIEWDRSCIRKIFQFSRLEIMYCLCVMCNNTHLWQESCKCDLAESGNGKMWSNFFRAV